ncbi:MAG: hypothetical protein KKA07_18390 [Bacteroidetes bacterium]|nr:hypothetical protein [Bacteroidota bacterium]MBU1721041.1 hypothetical protein [Bacteroidota bacterium]
MNRKLSHHLLIAFIAGLAITFSCVKEEYDFSKLKKSQSWTPELAMPLIHSNMNLADIIKDFDNTHLFEEDGDNFLKLVYQNTIYSKTAEQLLQIPDQSFPAVSESVNIPGAIPATDSLSYSFSDTYPFSGISADNPGETLVFDSMIVKEGTLTINLNTNLNYKTKLILEVPSMTKNGQTFRKVVYDKTDPTPVGGQKTYDLTGYKFSFDNSGPTTNAIDLNYEITVYGEGSPTYSPPYSMGITGGVSNIKFSKIFGNMGNLTFLLKKDTVFIDIFKNNLSTIKLELDSPRVKINVTNSYGIPIDINITNLATHSDVNAPYNVDVYQQPYPVTLNIPAPTLSQMYSGQSAYVGFTYDKNNSNIKTAVNTSPQYMLLDAEGASNSSLPTNFVFDTSRFQIDAITELPLFGKAWDITLQDTIPFAFGTTIENVDNIIFYIQVENGFPMEAFMQVYFADADYKLIDSLILIPTEKVIPNAPVGNAPEYRVIAPVKKVTLASMGRSRIVRVIDCQYLLVKAAMATNNNGESTVKIYSDYYIDVKIGVKADVSATIQIGE